MTLEMKPRILFSQDGVPGGESGQVVTPEAAAATAAHPEYELNAYVPATPEQVANPGNAPFISTPPVSPPLISVHAPGLSQKS